ncbi:D-arabinose 5-phosphate isomerase, partial [Pseudomonas edaphica]
MRDLIITAIIADFSSGYTISDMSQSSDLIQSAQRTIRLELEAVEGLLA